METIPKHPWGKLWAGVWRRSVTEWFTGNSAEEIPVTSPCCTYLNPRAWRPLPPTILKWWRYCQQWFRRSGHGRAEQLGITEMMVMKNRQLQRMKMKISACSCLKVVSQEHDIHCSLVMAKWSDSIREKTHYSRIGTTSSADGHSFEFYIPSGVGHCHQPRILLLWLWLY